MGEFEKRYRKIEAGQTNLKQKLVEFNNFVKEKQEKVADGKLKVKLEKKTQADLETKLDNLVQKKDLLRATFDALESNVTKKKTYESFLQTVVDANPEECQNIDEFLHRKSALMDVKTNLETVLANLTKESQITEKNLELFKEQKMKDTLVFSTKLGRNLQKLLDFSDLSTFGR